MVWLEEEGSGGGEFVVVDVEIGWRGCCFGASSRRKGMALFFEVQLF